MFFKEAYLMVESNLGADDPLTKKYYLKWQSEKEKFEFSNNLFQVDEDYLRFIKELEVVAPINESIKKTKVPKIKDF